MRLVAALLFAAIAAYAQSDCSADGTVLNSVTGAPIARARVSDKKDSSGLTDSLGKWKLDHLPCGKVSVSGTRQNFIDSQSSLDTTVDAPAHDVKILLAPQAVVTGRVIDDHGDPIQGATVAVKSSRVANGVRGTDYRFGAMTNDIGEFRIAGLSAGKFVFCASTGNPRISYVQIYAEQCSTLMPVMAGYNGSTDFQLVPLVMRRLSGSISGAPEGANLQLTMTGELRGFGIPVQPDGSFNIETVTSGQYNLTATAFVESDRFMGTATVAVGDHDVDGIRLHVEKGVDIAGKIQVVSATDRMVDNSRFAVGVYPNPGAAGPTIWNDDKTAFTLTGVTPGSYHFRFTVPDPFYVKSVTSGGHDITMSEVTIASGTPDIEVVLSDAGGTVEGDVSENTQAAWILLQGNEARHWYGRADAAGHFRMEGIPPGDYKVSAWDDIANVEYANPAWMQLNAKAVAANVQPGQASRVELTRKVAPVE